MKRKLNQNESKPRRARARAMPPVTCHVTTNNAGPSLAELRRRATERLQKVSLARAALAREETEAIVECERLGAARPLRAADQTRRPEPAVEKLSARPNPIVQQDSDEPEISGRWRQRTEELQADLKRALADNARLREDIGRLVSFLDELTGVLQGSPGRSNCKQAAIRS